MSKTTEQIKERLSIVDVVGSYLKLEKAGINYRARCPFHHEKTPSFFVSPTRNTYYCFGCGEKGDIFSFVERFEGADFPTALRMLGEKAGVPVVFEREEARESRHALHALLEEATQYFESNLPRSPEVKAYLKSRGVAEKTVQKFRIGFVPDGWRGLYDHLVARGYKEADIERAGLIKKGEKGPASTRGASSTRGGYYDRFRSRIMFPIADQTGKVIAFSGRIFPPSSDDTAKYINSPETVLFSKSKTLYAFHLAKIPIRKANFSIVVEGQMDVIMCHQSGFPNTVALSGTALTSEHVTTLKRLSPNILFALDADRAGIMSSGRSAELALSAGMDVKVARMPQGVDPADLAKKDPEELRRTIRESVHIIDFFLAVIMDSEPDPRKRGKDVQTMVLPFVARIGNSIDRMYFIERIARTLGMPTEAIIDEVNKLPKESPIDASLSDRPQEDQIHLSRKDIIIRRLLSIIVSEKAKKKSGIDVDDISGRLSSIIGEDALERVKNDPESIEEELLFTVEAGYENDDRLKRDVDDLLFELRKEYLQDDYRRALSELREAEREEDQQNIKKNLAKCKELAETLDQLRQSVESS